MEYPIADLKIWDEKIETLARKLGLNFYDQEFEIIDYNEMLSYEAYSGMPSRYPHWSFGKAYEKNKTLYRYNLTGLPYEMVINSDPCLAYLMKENTLLLQILTMAHVYGHNDFFKNNRLFKQGTQAEYTIEMFKTNADIIRGYINDPSIGYDNIEKTLNAAHSLRFQVSRVVGEKKIKDSDLKQQRLEEYKNANQSYDILVPYKKEELPDLSKIPLEPEDDILYFIINYGDLEEWQRNVLEIVRRESLYFIPQIETKIMNEGWASYWHYNILKELNLDEGLYLEFVKRHNDVVSPIEGGINPYFLGFRLFEDIKKRYGDKKIFEVRSLERDESFLRRYLTRELSEELNLFEYVKSGRDYFVKEVSDEEGWEEIRNELCSSCGMGSIPMIKVTEMSKKDKTLYLEHSYDGRELNISYAESTLKSINDLWGHTIRLKTITHNRETTLICNENKNITII